MLCWCQVLDGAMACLPEDSNGFEGMGNFAYKDYLQKVKSAASVRRCYQRVQILLLRHGGVPCRLCADTRHM
jgi:hypothetical protein